MPAPRALTAPDSEDIAFVRDTFLGRRFDYSTHAVFRDEHARGPWRSRVGRRHPGIDDALIERHLRQELALATYAGVETTAGGERKCLVRHLCIDVDASGSEADLRYRVRRVIAALGQPTFVLSSPSGGVHVYYVLGAPTILWDLRTPGGQGGAVVRLLEAAELELRAGRVEVYPAARMTEWAENVCRVPFGVGSYLLEPTDLTLRDSRLHGVDALRWVRERLADEELPLGDADQWLRDAGAMPPLPRSARRAKSNAFREEARRRAEPFKNGLIEFGTREQATAALAFLWLAEGIDDVEEAVTRIRAWLPMHHNGKSATWNRSVNKERVLREAEATVRRVYRWSQRRGVQCVRVQEPLLTVAEVLPLVAVAMSPDRCVDPRTGTPLDPYLLVEHGVWLLRRMLQEAMTQVRDKPELERNGRRGLAGRAWPDFAVPTFCVAVPLGLRMKPVPRCDGSERPVIAKNTEAAYFRALTAGDSPVLRCVHKHYAQGGLAAHYERPVDLDGARVVEDAADAFAALAGGEAAALTRVRDPERQARLRAAFIATASGIRAAPDTRELLRARALWREAQAADRMTGSRTRQSPLGSQDVSLPASRMLPSLPIPAFGSDADAAETYAGQPIHEWLAVERVDVWLDYGAPVGLVPEAYDYLDELAAAARDILSDELSAAAAEAEFAIRVGPAYSAHRVRVRMAGEERPGSSPRARRLAAGLHEHLASVLVAAGRELNLHLRWAA